MFHAQGGMQLTPAYDLVAAALYPEYNTLALSIDKRMTSSFAACGASTTCIRRAYVQRLACR
jgi:uncharacterized protein